MKTRTRITLLSVAALAMSLGLVLGVYSTLRMAAEARGILAEADSLSGNDSRTAAARSLLDGEQDAVSTLSEAALGSEELVGLLESLEESGRSMGLSVTISSIKSATAQSTTTPKTVEMVIDTKGPWSGSLSFVRLMQSLPYRTNLESASLTKDSDGGWRTGTRLKIVTFPE